jgi:hypothetical protein
MSLRRVGTPWSSVSTLAFDRVLENMRLVAQHSQASVADDPGSVRVAFFETTNEVLPWRFNYQREPATPLCSFGDEPDFPFDTLQHLMLLDELPAGWRYDPDERTAQVEGVQAGRQVLADITPETLATLDLMIGELIFGKAPLKSGGSIGDVIGAIWLGPKEPWSAQRYAEGLAHELVHQILFLEDMTHTIFAHSLDEMSEETGLISSAILQRPRSFDKAYHSALVSLVVIQLARAMGVAGERFDGLMAPTRTTIDEMLAKPQYMTDNGRRVLDEIDALWYQTEATT